MKLNCFLVSVFVLGIAISNAQDITPSVAKDNKIINMGIGLGATYYSGVGYTSIVPPISVSMDNIVKDGLIDGKGSLGVGGYIGYAAYKYDSAGYVKNYSSFFVGPRGTFHYGFVDKLDTYVGIFLGYEAVLSAKTTGTNVPTGFSAGLNPSRFVFSTYIGGRYFITDKFAGMLELGYGISWLNIGVAAKL
jgi:hypothetical protein